MNDTLAVLRLHLVRRDTMFLTPVGILAAVMVLSIIIALAIQRATGGDLGADYVEGARWNQGMVWSLPGFLVYIGVQAVATTFPLGMSLGSTRRSYVSGTLFAYLVLSVYITVVMTLLLLIELATNHWFVGVYIFDVYLLGAGDVGQFALTVLLGTLLMFSIGGAFGAAFVRYRSKGPLILGLGAILVIAIAVLAIGPGLGPLFADFQPWWLAVGAAILLAVSLVGTYALLRRASVR